MALGRTGATPFGQHTSRALHCTVHECTAAAVVMPAHRISAAVGSAAPLPSRDRVRPQHQPSPAQAHCCTPPCAIVCTHLDDCNRFAAAGSDNDDRRVNRTGKGQTIQTKRRTSQTLFKQQQQKIMENKFNPHTSNKITILDVDESHCLSTAHAHRPKLLQAPVLAIKYLRVI